MRKRETNRRVRTPGAGNAQATAAQTGLADRPLVHPAAEAAAQGSLERAGVRFFDDVDPETRKRVGALIKDIVDTALTLELDPALGGRDDRLWRAALMRGATPYGACGGGVALAIRRPAARETSGGPRRKGSRMTGLSRTEAEAAMTVPSVYPHIVLKGEGLDGNALALVAAARSAMGDEGVPEGELDAFAGEALSADYAHVLRTVGSRVRILWKPRRAATRRPEPPSNQLKENGRDKRPVAAAASDGDQGRSASFAGPGSPRPPRVSGAA